MLYGWCFYPLFAIGIAQVARTVETAVKLRCAAIDAPPKLDFNGAIDYLAKYGGIDPELKQRLHLIRKFRNETTHLSDQDVLPPAVAVDLLRTVTTHLNALFPDHGD